MHPALSFQQYQQPYNFCTLFNCFEEEDASRVYRDLSIHTTWKLHTESFFEQWEYKIEPNDAVLYPVLDAYGQEIKRFLEDKFDTVLDSRFEIVAHRLTRGQRIAIHTDCPLLGRETHRFVVNLNPGYEDTMGGHFYVCLEKDAESIFKILRPVINSGFAFEASRNSYHAVGKMLEGDRFSIVFSYWHIGNTKSKKAWVWDTITSARTRYEGEIASQDLALLRRFQLDQVRNTKNSLFDHLVETYAILKSWNMDESVCRVGLFHSLMGTKYVSLPFQAEARSLLFEQDRLVAQGVEQYALMDIDLLGEKQLTCDEIALLHVYYANLLTGTVNKSFSTNGWKKEKARLAGYGKFLHPASQASLAHLFDIAV